MEVFGVETPSKFKKHKKIEDQTSELFKFKISRDIKNQNKIKKGKC